MCSRECQGASALSPKTHHIIHSMFVSHFKKHPQMTPHHALHSLPSSSTCRSHSNNCLFMGRREMTRCCRGSEGTNVQLVHSVVEVIVAKEPEAESWPLVHVDAEIFKKKTHKEIKTHSATLKLLKIGNPRS